MSTTLSAIDTSDSTYLSYDLESERSYENIPKSETAEIEQGEIYVNGTQKFFTYAGYYSTSFARSAFRSIERLTHTMPKESYWSEVAERVKGVATALLFIPLAALFLVPAALCYSIAALAGKGRFEYTSDAKATPSDLKTKNIKVCSLNACFQDPYSPLSGGIVTPFEPIGDVASRIAAIVNEIGERSPDVFLGQEFENISAQDEFMRLMLREKGYSYIVRDLGSNHPVSNCSGLFIASKTPLKNIKFIPYPLADRSGLARWSAQGALTFTVSLGNKELRLVNTHLNYGEEVENQKARERQLKNHIAPLLQKGDAVLFGDLNFDTSTVDKDTLGLGGFINAIEGEITCSDDGKHTLRGKSYEHCTGCKESIDGVIYNPKELRVATKVEKLMLNNQLLSDHFLTTATIQMI